MKRFEEFIGRDVKKQRVNFARAKSLILEAENRYRFLKSIPKKDENANYIIENAYDVIREVVEAKLNIDGWKSYSHEATISYLRKLKLPESNVVFADEMRRTRNSIKYLGEINNLDYALRVFDFVSGFYTKILNRIEI